MKTKLKLQNGMVFTVTVEKEDDYFLEGKDKFGSPVKIDKKDILTRIPVYEESFK